MCISLGGRLYNNHHQPCEHTLDADSFPAVSAQRLLTNWIPDCNRGYMRDRIRRSRSSAKSDRTSKPISRKAHTHSSDPAANYQRNQSAFLIPFESSLSIYTAGPNWFLWREWPLITPCPKTPSPSPSTSPPSYQSTFCKLYWRLLPLLDSSGRKVVLATNLHESVPQRKESCAY